MDSGSLDAWTLDAWTQDAWTLEAWTLDDWSQEAWILDARMLGVLTIGRSDSALAFLRIFRTTIGHVNFNKHFQLLQIFTGLYAERTSLFINKANRNLKGY